MTTLENIKTICREKKKISITTLEQRSIKVEQQQKPPVIIGKWLSFTLYLCNRSSITILCHYKPCNLTNQPFQRDFPFLTSMCTKLL